MGPAVFSRSRCHAGHAGGRSGQYGYRFQCALVPFQGFLVDFREQSVGHLDGRGLALPVADPQKHPRQRYDDGYNQGANTDVKRISFGLQVHGPSSGLGCGGRPGLGLLKTGRLIKKTQVKLKNGMIEPGMALEINFMHMQWAVSTCVGFLCGGSISRLKTAMGNQDCGVVTVAARSGSSVLGRSLF